MNSQQVRRVRKLSVVLLTSLVRVASYYHVAVLQMALLNWESLGARLVLQRFETLSLGRVYVRCKERVGCF